MEKNRTAVRMVGEYETFIQSPAHPSSLSFSLTLLYFSLFLLYAAWNDSRSRQIEADLQRASERDPVIPLAEKVTRQLREKIGIVN
jgi:hypothetical protein